MMPLPVTLRGKELNNFGIKSMSIWIFTGSTLSHRDGKMEMDAIYLPPVSQGDVYRVAIKKPFAIGIIDGYFDRVPAVWHKEIMWAMAQGIHVFGSASMGALRAAELDVFGMKGIGRVYEAFRDGHLEDDDEVAVAHSDNHIPSSEAMVNIRFTLKKAEHHGVIHSITRTTLEHIAKGTFYPDRTYPGLLQQARRESLPANEITALERWLPTGRIDQKRDDAIAMLRALRTIAKNGKIPKKANYVFEHSYAWEQLRHEAGELKIDTLSTQAIFTGSILEELRLEGDSYIKAADECLLRLLLQEKLGHRNEQSDDASLLEALIEFREARGLLSSSDIHTWLKEHRLTKDAFLQFMHEEARLQKAKAALAEQFERLLPPYLQLTGQYGHLARRAVDKRRILSELGIENPTAHDVGMDDRHLLEWYFRDRFNKAPSSNLMSYVRHLGFRDEEDFIETIRREKCYVMHVSEQSQPTHARNTPPKKMGTSTTRKSSKT